MDPVSTFLLMLLFGGSGAASPAPVPAPVPGPVRPPAPRPAPPPVAQSFPFPQDTRAPARPAQWPPVDESRDFPGPGWVPDNPVPPEVIARASALLPVLWARGVGQWVNEQTGGRDIIYQAVAMGEGKRGVVAFRRASAAPAAAAPVSYPAPAPPAPVAPPMASPVAPLPVAIPASSPVSLPILQLGDRGPDVTMLQKKLGWTRVTDFFGAQTLEKVREFQKSQGLPMNGIVDATVWARLFGSSA